MRIISGTLRSTPVPWLPVLCHITPPKLRRETAIARMAALVQACPALPLYPDLFDPPTRRLPSRRPLWAILPSNQAVSVGQRWREEWSKSTVTNHQLVDDPTTKPPGFDLPRKLWTLLNRFRTGHGRCAVNDHRWGLRNSPLCECGMPQTMSHIVEDCPLTRLDGGLRTLLALMPQHGYIGMPRPLSTNCPARTND